MVAGYSRSVEVDSTAVCAHTAVPDYSGSTETHQAIAYPRTDDPNFATKEFDFWTQSFTVEQRRECREGAADRRRWARAGQH